MPNWVMNRWVFSGNNARSIADEILSVDKESWNHKLYVDFNKVDKMPGSMDVVCGSLTTPACEYYLSSINPDCPEVAGDKWSREDFKAYLEKVNANPNCRKLSGTNEFGVQERDFDTLGGGRGYLAYGKTIAENRANYGADTWYEWSRDHWGVKWNASDSKVQFEPQKATIWFKTPWDQPKKLMLQFIQKYSVKYPDTRIKMDWSEEQLGEYLDGSLEAVNGEIESIKDYEQCSKEAQEHFMELWDMKSDFVYDPKTDKYKPCWEKDEDDSEEEAIVEVIHKDDKK